MAQLQIDISQTILAQFSAQLEVQEQENCLFLDASIGIGKIKLANFRDTLELYHFSFKLKNSLQLDSLNPRDSDYILLNINLSERAIEKTVNGQELDIQKYLPSGILCYPPNTKVSSISPINTDFEIILVRFHKDLLSHYFAEKQGFLFEVRDSIVYEDLDFQSEKLIRQAVNSPDKLKSHLALLGFLSIFFDKINTRATQIQYENVHPTDLKQLFFAAAMLRNPVNQNLPTIDDLAKTAGMGKTKFKNTFKQVFGSAPKQYHQKIKMDYAKSELQKKLKTPTEVAYELGYADPSKFTRAFKKSFHCTPSEI